MYGGGLVSSPVPLSGARIFKSRKASKTDDIELRGTARNPFVMCGEISFHAGQFHAESDHRGMGGGVIKLITMVHPLPRLAQQKVGGTIRYPQHFFLNTSAFWDT